jgi:hypothetical protein
LFKCCFFSFLFPFFLAAGIGAMMALSGVAGTRCSFLQVSESSIGRNPKVPAPRDDVLKGPKKRAKIVRDADGNNNNNNNNLAEGTWFPRLNEWGQQIV